LSIGASRNRSLHERDAIARWSLGAPLGIVKDVLDRRIVIRRERQVLFGLGIAMSPSNSVLRFSRARGG
jgi:hypothetical protein